MKRGLSCAAALFVAATLVWRALGTSALDDDGPGLVTLLSDARGGIATWHHAAYLPLGALVERVVGVGRSLEALLWVSACAAGAALVLVAGAQRRVQGERRGRWGRAALLALALSPALWLNATRVEVHTLQMFGAALATYALLATRARPSWQRAAVGLVVGVVAVTCHNSNALLLPGLAWLATSNSAGGRSGPMGERLAIVAAIGVGGGLGLVLDRGAVGAADALSVPLDLVVGFARPPGVAFLWNELVLGWFPLLAVAGAALLVARARLRDVFPLLAAALPPLILFASLGIATAGGYFTSAMALLAVAVAGLEPKREADPARAPVSSPLARRVGLALFAVVLLAGLVRSFGNAFDPWRAALQRMGVERLAIARELLPDGGVVVAFDPFLQVVGGRVPGLFELPVHSRIVGAARRGVEPQDFAATLDHEIATHASHGSPLVYWSASAIFAQNDGATAEHVAAFETCLARHYVLEPRVIGTVPLTFGVPRPLAGAPPRGAADR